MHCGSFAWVAVDVGCEFPGDVSWTACVWTLPVAGTSLCMEAEFQEQVSQERESGRNFTSFGVTRACFHHTASVKVATASHRVLSGGTHTPPDGAVAGHTFRRACGLEMTCPSVSGLTPRRLSFPICKM